MPIYEEEGRLTREDLLELRKQNKCQVCGASLNLYLDPDSGKAFLACWDWPRTHHDGIEREASRYEKEGLGSLNIPTRREIMEKKHGAENTKALAKYQMSALVTREMATEIVETLWKGASPIAKTKAILICATYNLNPLMNHLFILPFKKKDGTTEHVVAIGIEATRLMAHRPDSTTGIEHNLTYLDLTPRRATRDELEKILGDEVDPKKLYFITKIKDLDTGAEVHGLGWWEGSVYGEDKGNSPANMASIRSERQALKRLYPAEMPAGVEVVDERFAQAAGEGVVEGEFKDVTEETKEEPEPKEHWCEEHNCTFEKKTRGSSTWYAHKLPDGNWCNEGKKKQESSQVEAVEESQQPKRDPDTIRTLNDLYKACNEDFKLQPAQVISELGVSSQSDIFDTPAECYRKIAAVR